MSVESMVDILGVWSASEGSRVGWRPHEGYKTIHGVLGLMGL